MPGSFRPQERRFPLHVHISALFILLLMLAGSALGLFNYRQTSAIIFSSSATLFDHIQDDVQQDITSTYQPIRHLLGVLALSTDAQGDLQQRLRLLAPMAQALRDNPKLSALHLGYASGDFFMLRVLRTRAIQQQFDAPAGSAFQLWSITHAQDGTRQGEYLFYDDKLEVLERRPLGLQDFDPRQREWYSGARQQDATVTTTPYVFFSSGVIGTTLARPVNDQAVIAADLTLEELSATLLKHKITANSEVMLFDGNGNAVAYPDSHRLIIDGPRPHRAKVSEILPHLASLLSDLNDEQTRNVVQLHKQRWVVSRSHVAEGGPDGLYLALLVPEDELLAEAYRIRWQSALITLTALLLCLPMGWLVSRCITRPLASLQRQAEAMGRFDFAAASGVRSSVLEVDCLALAMARMTRSLTRYQNIVAELGHQPDTRALMQWVLRQSITALQAQAGVAYRVQDGRLQACAVEFDGLLDTLDSNNLRSHELSSAQLPSWLRQAVESGTAAQPLGFDKAADLQPLLNAIDAPLANLLAVALRSEQGELFGILLLLQNERVLQDDQPDLFSEQCVAFAQMVARITARHLQSRPRD